MSLAETWAETMALMKVPPKAGESAAMSVPSRAAMWDEAGVEQSEKKSVVDLAVV